MRAGLLGRSLVVLVAVVAGACGGSDDGVSPTTVATTATTTLEPSTTAAASTTTAPRVPVPAADPAAVSRAEKAVLVPADYPAGWGEFQAAGGVLRDINPTSRIGCALQPTGSLAPTALAAVVDGPITQKGTTKRYATSFALGFTSDASAQEAVNAFRAPTWSACRVAAKTRDAKAQPGGAVDPQWRADPIDDTGRGQGGFEGAVRLQYQATLDGKLVDANGYETVLFYRIGRVVLAVAAEGQNDDADPPDLNKAITDEMDAAINKALARLR